MASRPLQNAVLAAAIAVEVIVLIGHPLFGWGPKPHRFAVTPPLLAVAPAGPPSARSVLLDLSAAAARTARRSRDSATAGRVAWVRRETWQLADQHVPGHRPRRALTRLVSTWRRADGSGAATILAQTAGGGSRTIRLALPAGARLPALTGSPAELDRRLGLGHATSTATAVDTLAALADRQPLPPGAEAEILRLLAGDAGLADAGTTRDRAGRPGLAISFSPASGSTPVRDTLVFDPGTGALEEFDRALAGPRGDRDAPAGSLLSFTLYLAAGRVARIGQEPTSAR